jgi:hypothetical protein
MSPERDRVNLPSAPPARWAFRSAHSLDAVLRPCAALRNGTHVLPPTAAPPVTTPPAVPAPRPAGVRYAKTHAHRRRSAVAEASSRSHLINPDRARGPNSTRDRGSKAQPYRAIRRVFATMRSGRRWVPGDRRGYEMASSGLGRTEKCMVPSSGGLPPWKAVSTPGGQGLLAANVEQAPSRADPVGPSETAPLAGWAQASRSRGRRVTSSRHPASERRDKALPPGAADGD